MPKPRDARQVWLDMEGMAAYFPLTKRKQALLLDCLARLPDGAYYWLTEWLKDDDATEELRFSEALGSTGVFSSPCGSERRVTNVFLGDDLLEMSQEDAVAVIAHQIALLWEGHHLRDPSSGEGTPIEEADSAEDGVDNLVRTWGFHVERQNRRANMRWRNCYNCCFLLRFTPAEAETYRAKLSDHGVPGRFFGACTHSSRDRPLVISRYLDRPVGNCAHWRGGHLSEPVGASCPRCGEGDVVVIRPARQKQTYTLIGCSLYPSCRFATTHLPLQTLCRFCGVPLVLGAGERLICYCPECERTATIPLTLAGWPHLFRKSSTCPHGLQWDKCELCERSRTERRSVVELELPTVVEHELQARRTRTDTGKQASIGAVDASPAMADEYYESLPSERPDGWSDSEVVLEYLDDYSQRWARSTEEGWFYEE
jgi:ssDNA-binding Zn-finger/Zn-ribbon topoisomerase 1